jgi:hypothetical protein
MWSDRYYYLNIYKDETLSAEANTEELKNFTSTIPELEVHGKFEFKNRKTFPFPQLLLLKAKSLDSWNGNDTNYERTNLITIVCSKGKGIYFDVLKGVFIKIASFLNWILVEEETDNGIKTT